MSLADRMRETPPTRSCRTGVCSSCKWIDALAPEDRAVLDSWVSSGYSVSQLYDNCVQEGLELNLSTFSRCLKRHRNLSR